MVTAMVMATAMVTAMVTAMAQNKTAISITWKKRSGGEIFLAQKNSCRTNNYSYKKYMQKTTDTPEWDLVIQPQSSLFSLNLRDVWRYRDLLVMFVKRDFVSFYKQTILGPCGFSYSHYLQQLYSLSFLVI